jgi:hypothetical protein
MRPFFFCSSGFGWEALDKTPLQDEGHFFILRE